MGAMSSAPFLPSVSAPSKTESAPSGRKNVVRILAAWYVACQSKDLAPARGREGVPVARTVLGVPLVLFRGADGAPGALLDRCPHRNVPLSLGKVKDGELSCRYHGWRYDCRGHLQAIPGLPVVDDEPVDMPGRRCAAYPCLERDGYVWVWMQPTANGAPAVEPFDLPQTRWPGYLTVRWEADVEGTLHSTLENILDVPHTSFLHGGLFRPEEKKNVVTAVVRRRRDGVEAEFIGEPRPEGIAGRILSPSGGVVEHFDRFFLPSVAQVEYRLGSENHIVTTTMCTPVTETRTRMFTALSVKTHLPVNLVAPLVMPFAWKILAQDKWILKAQTELVDKFGTETFSSTAIDLLGPHILHLLKKAEAGATEEAIVREETFKILT
jgi:phenylpropionate dioxygenase-like ring-hydroxylating dioxygenase large terminal subunit